MSTPGSGAVILEYGNAFNRGDLDTVCRQFAPDALVYGVLGFGGLLRWIGYSLGAATTALVPWDDRQSQYTS